MSVIPPSLKILVLTTSFPLFKGSRSGIFVKKLVDNLPPELMISVLTPDGTAHYTPELLKYPLIRFRYAPKGWQQLAHGAGGIMAVLSQRRITCLLIPLFLISNLVTSCWYAVKTDVIHANWSINGVLAGIAGFLTRTPVVTTLRGSDVNMMSTSWMMRQFVYLSLCLSRRIVVVSASMKKSVVKEFPAHHHKVQIIHNGIDDAFYKNNNNIFVPSKIVRFLYVGNLVEGKGVKIIVKALKSLVNLECSLDIVGDGREKQYLVNYCNDNRLDSKVTFHGAVAPEKVPLFLQKADVFVFASFAEGRPNAVLEAMAMGLPIIASAIPAVQELITDGFHGLLFPPGNEEKLQDAMKCMITCREDRRMMGKNAEEYILAQELSWRESADQYATVYKDVYMSSTRTV